MHVEPLTADTVTATLTCAVTGAAGDQTAFTIAHSASGLTGQGHLVDATCSGLLHAGTGTCTKTFIPPAHTAGLGSVTGELLPSHSSLGTVTPTPVS